MEEGPIGPAIGALVGSRRPAKNKRQELRNIEPPTHWDRGSPSRKV
jgi:hypothetical protein